MDTDDALQSALAQFNEGLKVQQAEDRANKAVAKVERRKQQAASTLKNVQGDANATAAEKAEAESAYRETVEELKRLKAGEDDTSGDDASTDETPEETADDTADPEPSAEGADAPAEEPATEAGGDEAEGDDTEA